MMTPDCEARKYHFLRSTTCESLLVVIVLTVTQTERPSEASGDASGACVCGPFPTQTALGGENTESV